jgi:hypothetical protein
MTDPNRRSIFDFFMTTLQREIERQPPLPPSRSQSQSDENEQRQPTVSRSRSRSVEEQKSPSVSPSNSKSRSSIRSMETSLDETQLNTTCITLLSDTNNPTFRDFTNKLKKICHQHLEKCDHNRLTQIRIGLESDPKIMTNLQYTISIIPEQPFWPQIMNAYIHTPSSTPNFMMSPARKLKIDFIGQIGQGVGLTRTFIQGCLDNIRDHGFFIKTDELSDRYVLNPNLTIEKLHRLGYHIENEYQLQIIYEKIGVFFQFCMISGYPIGFYLSRSLLYKILKPSKISTSSSDTFVFYLLLEMPSISTSIINLLRHPETIQDTGLEFNDDYPLVSADALLTADNFRTYLQLRAVHQFTQQFYPKAFNTQLRIEAFRRGFKKSRSKLKEYEMTVPELDKFLCGNFLTLESFVKWYNDPLRVNYSPSILGSHRDLKDHFEWILKDNGESFPYVELDIKRPSTSEERKEIFLDFVTKLLAFWSGLRTIHPSATYQVTAIDNQFPKSSTCFYQLKLPIAVPSREELYRRLVVAVYNIEQGVGLAGGKKQKT